MLERPKGNTKVDNKQGGPSMICVPDSPAAGETRVPHTLPRSWGPCPRDQSSWLWAPREMCSRRWRRVTRQGRRKGGKDTFTKSLLSTNGGNGNSLPFAFCWGSPILNYEASDQHHCGFWKVSTPSFIRPGRCISSSQQVHQKQVFGNKWRDNHREMWPHLSNKQLPKTLGAVQNQWW